MSLRQYNNKIMNYLPTILPYIISFAILTILIWMITTGKFNSAIRGLVVAIPALTSCYYVIRFKKDIIALNQKINFTVMTETSLFYLFWILFFASISALLLHDGRPWYYFLFMAINYVIIILQILSKNRNSTSILFEILILTLNLIYSVTLNYDLYFGTTDLLPHTFMSQVTYLSGHIIPVSLNEYAYFPLYHIWISEAANMLNLSVKTSLFLITAPIFAMTILFIYYVFLGVLDNQQIALLSCILYSVSSGVLYYSVNVITRTIAFIGFVMILYLIYSKSSIKHKTLFKIISIYMAIFLALMHQVSLLQIMFLFVVISISEFISENKRYISLDYFTLFGTIFISYWFFVAYSFFKNQMAVRLQLSNLDSVSMLQNAEIVKHEWINTVGLLDQSICIFFSLIAILYLLNNYKDNYASVFGLVAMFALIFYAPTPLSNIRQFAIIYRMDRMILFISPFLSFAMGLGVYLSLIKVSCNFNSSRKIAFSVILGLLFIFTFISLVYSVSDSDDIWITPMHEYFTLKELNGFNFVNSKVPLGSSIHSDTPTSRYFPLKFELSDSLFLPYYSSKEIGDVRNIPMYNGYTLIRDREFSINGLYFGEEESETGYESSYFYPNTNENRYKLYSYLNSSNKIYSSPVISLYVNS